MIRHLNFILSIVLLLFISSCGKTKETILKEAWIEKPVSEWPDLIMTNTVEFSDTTYKNIGDVFLVDTGSDTLAISCKHIFMIFRNETNNKINSISKNAYES
ncbi:hypothetical protein GM418_04375 [Maribellus comscasis]|uniref:Uncharacterized protein n=1 Tax=Maribellus comscasis TaxID=2681766 RepID=A0A6I6JPE2_9BACT|nr:hypothetical protein [Maribellus comscasis]QGY42918.1 hypothetical protein GM418_04375 [Maribellus comscasis]